MVRSKNVVFNFHLQLRRLLIFFFRFDHFLHHHTLSLTVQLRPEPVHTIFCIRSRVDIVANYNKYPIE